MLPDHSALLKDIPKKQRQQTSGHLSGSNIARLLRILNALYDVTRDCELCTYKLDAILYSEKHSKMSGQVNIR
jgi:hypothetical protein